MTQVVIVKCEDGRLRGLGQEGERAYNKWRRMVADMEIGETLEFGFTAPRSPKHHRKFFAIVRSLLEHTEAFTDFDALRDWLTVGVGVVEPDGAGGYRAKSMSFTEMEEPEFSELVRKATDFLFTERAQRVLWRHLDQQKRDEMVRSVLTKRGSA